MSDTLIISGWSVDMALGAAMAAALVESEPEIVALSQRRLPEAFAEWAKEKTPRWKQILIIGLGLWNDVGSFRHSLKVLHGEGIKVVWIAVFLPESVPKLPLTMAVFPEADTLAEAVSAYFGQEKLTPAAKRIMRLAEQPQKTLPGEDAAWISLLMAASSLYRRFQNEEAMPEAVRLLASGKAMDLRHKKMIDEHRQFGSRELLGVSPVVQELWEKTRILGQEGKCRILITGETGVGKETVAYLIHGHSPRASEPFVFFNCADLSPQLLEGRLFGYEKGAFTGATQAHVGLFEQANHGTLFLDEVGELSPEIQAGLLRVLQEGRFRRLGGTVEIETDARIIAATNRNLSIMVWEGKFRADLFYRLNVVPIHVPPLREHKEDIAKIANTFLHGRQTSLLTPIQLKVLQSYDWPGNVRELFNILERATVLKVSNYQNLLDEHCCLFTPESTEHQGDRIRTAKTIDLTSEDALSNIVLQHVQAVYERYGHNKTHTAKALDITVNTLKGHLKKLEKTSRLPTEPIKHQRSKGVSQIR
jgi:transcriptional regulator with PAS, ATPase and Fis domain